MNRSLKLSMLVALALGCSHAMALDLGQVQVKSALGQPLLAEIPLHPANPAELRGLTVQLASTEQFARAGIVGGRTTIPLHFSVANVGTGHAVIRITSSVPVDDPYLDLLLEVNGHAGKSVREYAILLDPPGMSTAAAPAPAPSTPSVARPARVAAPVAPARAAHAATPAPAAASVSKGSYGPVQPGQTLTGIARSVSPTGVDLQQMLLALKQANPDAFYRDNINALKSGAVLRVPTSTEAQAMTLAAAAAEVRRQNSDWRAGTPGKPAILANAATRSPAASAPGATPTGNADRLALVPPKVGAGTSGQATGGTGDKTAAGLREDLLRAKESVASLQQQSSDLKTRLKDLTDINSKNEHLLSLKDSEIAELQAKLAAARKAAPAAASSAAAAAKPQSSGATALETAVARAGTSAGAANGEAPVAAASTALAAPAAATSTSVAASGSTAVAAAVSSTAAAVPASAPAAVKPAPKPVPTPAPTVEQPWYMQMWAWIAGAVVLLLIVLAAIRRRRKPAAGAGASLADRFSAAPETDDEHPDDDADQEQLLDQLAEHPDDIYLHLELVTLYYSRRDVERFEAAAEAMHAHITDPGQDEWQDVLHMGEDLAPEHPLFDHHVETAAPAVGALDQEFDIDDYAHPTTTASSQPPVLPTEAKKVSEYNFNFDLTQPANSASALEHPPERGDAVADAPHPESAQAWADLAEPLHPEPGQAHEANEFSDDPVDTKLDLARAYVDMGDADGARAMLGEVLREGSQMQRDTAQRLLDGLS